MTPEERRGKIYLLIYIAVVALVDLTIKGLLLAQGTLRWSQGVGTVITLITLWYLWRGHAFAFWFLVACMALSAFAITLTFYGLSSPILAICLAFIAAITLALIAPATRRFLSFQRAARA